MIKKLFLISAILLATNAWGEIKKLNCEIKTEDDSVKDYSISFDLDLPIAEISITNANGIISFWEDTRFFNPELAVYELKITPTKLIFTQQATNKKRISVNRQNLLAELSEKTRDFWMSVGSGPCKIQKVSRKI